MDSRGLLVRVEARSGKDAEVAELLRSALPLVRGEPRTTAWFALRFGRSEYGIFDVFPEDDAREEHLRGPVAQALIASELFTRRPSIRRLDVLAEKLPRLGAPGLDRKALLLTFRARKGHEAALETFLRDARSVVDAEPRTTAWFAIKLGDGEYGIFDAFPDNGGRFAHLVGHVPRELAKRARALGGFPDLEMPSVVADKLPS